MFTNFRFYVHNKYLINIDRVILRRVIMSNEIKSYNNRDSATAMLRKQGIEAVDYNKFIISDENRFHVDLVKVNKFLSSKKTKVVKKSAEPKEKAVKKSAEPKEKAARKTCVSSVARSLILAGKSNDEVWTALKAQFNLDDKKRSYASWYRWQLHKQGELTN